MCAVVLLLLLAIIPPNQVTELYYLQESDAPKDSSNQCSLVARALDEIESLLAKQGRSLPANLVIQA
jgi:hypothetical protein